MHAMQLLAAVEVGQYVSIWKILVLVIFLLIWARLLTWMDKDAIDARLLQSDAGVTQTREVSGQHGGDDRDWARHDIGSYRAPAFGNLLRCSIRCPV